MTYGPDIPKKAAHRLLAWVERYVPTLHRRAALKDGDLRRALEYAVEAGEEAGIQKAAKTAFLLGAFAGIGMTLSVLLVILTIFGSP